MEKVHTVYLLSTGVEVTRERTHEEIEQWQVQFFSEKCGHLQWIAGVGCNGEVCTSNERKI